MIQPTPSSKHSSLSAFSVGEVLLAAFVLAIGIVTVVGLMNFALRSSLHSSRLIVASELAQEGVELVRNVRDNNLARRANEAPTPTTPIFDPNPSTSGFPNASNDRCSIGYLSGVINCAGGPTDMRLSLDSPSGFYRHIGVDGRYYRRVFVDVNGAGSNETARVLSFVAWKNPGNNLNNNITNALNWCNLGNNCVYTELLLTAWEY